MTIDILSVCMACFPSARGSATAIVETRELTVAGNFGPLGWGTKIRLVVTDASLACPIGRRWNGGRYKAV